MRQRILLATLCALLAICVPVYWLHLSGSLGANGAGADELLDPQPLNVAPTGGIDADGPLMLRGRDPDFRENVDFGILLREIVRQGVLVAARDELGLPTRDTTLREELAANSDPKNLPLDVLVRCRLDHQVEATLVRYKLNQREVVWVGKWTVPWDGFYEKMVAEVEPLSRGAISQALVSAGFSRRPVAAPRVSAELPPGVSEQLNELTVAAQFAALRSLHAESRLHGESPELLGALARAYATMGVLTERLWSPAHKAFKARALVYAERGVNRWPESTISLRHRALVRALLGFHRAALADLQVAAGRDDKRSTEQTPWVPVVESLCKFDEAALDTLAKEGAQPALARIAQLQIAELSDSQTEVIRVSEKLTEAAPNCLRAIDGAATLRDSLAIQKSAADQGVETARRYLLREVRQIAGLPGRAAELIDGLNAAGDSKSTGPKKGTTDEMPVRLQVIDELKKAGSVVGDTQEPAWGVLGQLLEEITFLQSWRRVDVAEMAGEGVNAEIDAVWPQVERHPWAQFIACYRSDWAKSHMAKRSLRSTIDASELELREMPMIDRIARHELAIKSLVEAHQDEGAGEIFDCITKTEGRDERFAARLREISPATPFGIAASITHENSWTDEQLKQAEMQLAHCAAVQTALGKRYLQQDRQADSICCLEAAVKLDPSRVTLEALADSHLKSGNEEAWLAALEHFLSTGRRGTGDTEVRMTIVNHFVEQRQWNKARPYAERAAASGSEAALIKAAQCAEAEQDWEAAEKHYSLASKRYLSAAFEWHKFCKRTGHGDEALARKAAVTALEQLQANNEVDWYNVGIFRVLDNDAPGAVDALKKSYSDIGVAAIALRCAMVLDGMGEGPSRDSLLAEACDPMRFEADQVIYSKLAAMLVSDLEAGGKAEIDEQALASMIGEGRLPGVKTGVAHVAAWYLDQHGQRQRAVELWKSRMGDIDFTNPSRTLAGAELCKHGVRPEEYKDLIWQKPAVEEPAKGDDGG